jgi:hypothetical protein
MREAKPPGEAHQLGEIVEFWPTPFADKAAARVFLSDSRLTAAWIDDLEVASEGLKPRFGESACPQTCPPVCGRRRRPFAEWVYSSTEGV